MASASSSDYDGIERLLSKALSADETNQPELALPLYCEAEQRIVALTQRLRAAQDWRTVEKLDTFLGYVLDRKDALQTKTAPSDITLPSAPPAQEAPPFPPYEQLLRLSRPDAQLVTVSENHVSVPSYPDYLEVNVFSGPEGQPFLRLGSWSCPLIPGETPILLSEENQLCTLMLPNPASLRPGDSVAILLSRDIDRSERQLLLQVLDRLSALKMRDPALGSVRALTPDELGYSPKTEPPGSSEASTCSGTSTSDRIANAIAQTSVLVAHGVQKGAEKGSQLLARGGQALRDRLARPERAHQPADERVVSGAATLRQGSHVVAQTTEKAVTVLAKAVRVAAQWAAPHVKNGARQVLPPAWTNGTNGEPSKAAKVWVVASAAIAGAATVYEELEQGAKVIGRTVAKGTGEVVGARYGRSSGSVAENLLFSAGNVGMTPCSMKKFATRTAVTAVSLEAEEAERRRTDDVDNNGKGPKKESPVKTLPPKK